MLSEKIKKLKDEGYFDCNTCLFKRFCNTGDVCTKYVSVDVIYGNAEIIKQLKEGFSYICLSCGSMFKRKTVTMPGKPFGSCKHCGNKLEKLFT